MESYDQPHGCIVYRTSLPAGTNEDLVVRELRDFAWVFLDGRRLGSLDRRLGQRSIKLPARKAPATLDLLVEAMGRINYGREMADRKGITDTVQLVVGRIPRDLTGWEVFNLPLYEKDLASLKFEKSQTNSPAFHRVRFGLKETRDTFLDMGSWGKGVAWINGRNLGRFWSIGPQQTLYCPGPWLKPGANELIVLELSGAQQLKIVGVSEPRLNQLNDEARR
jgi:beta-galactosidase